MSKKQELLNSVPPYMPIIIEDWQSDPDTQSMSDVQVGIFVKALFYQWQNGSLPRDPWKFAKKIDSRYETVIKFLQTYPKRFTCTECERKWTVNECGCGKFGVSVARVENTKLKLLRIDVNSNLPLGTTESNRAEK